MLVFYFLVLLLFCIYHWRAWRQVKVQVYADQSEPLLYEKPLVSFLVPAWNAADEIPAFLHAYRALTYPSKELILCVGGDDNGFSMTQDLLMPGEVLLEQKKGMGKQKSLQLCFEASKGKLIYLTDIDCLVEDESFTKVLLPLLKGNEEVVTGSSKPVKRQQGIGSVLVHWALVRKAEGVKGTYVKGILGRNCVLTRVALNAIGGFSFDAPTGTDYRLAQTLMAKGYQIWREPLSEIPTEYAWPFKSYVRKRARWVRNILLFAKRPKQNAEFFNALSVVLIPALMLGAVLLSLLLVFWLPPVISFVPLFLVALMLAHGVLNRLRYLKETLGEAYVKPSTIWGALINWLGQLAAGLWALYTWAVPSLRKQW